MPSDTHRITGLTLEGEPIREASGSLVVATSEIDTSAGEYEPTDIDARRSWRGTLVVPDPDAIHDRLVAATAERGIQAEFELDAGVQAHGYIALPPAYERSESGEVEFAGVGDLRGVPFPDVERR